MMKAHKIIEERLFKFDFVIFRITNIGGKE